MINNHKKLSTTTTTITVGLVALALAVAGCATDAVDNDDNNGGGVEENDPNVTTDDEAVASSSAELTQGGCSNQQIRDAQASCRRVYGAKSRGIQFCKKYGPGYGYVCSVRK